MGSVQTVKVKNPNGIIAVIAANDLEKYKNLGYTLATKAKGKPKKKDSTPEKKTETPQETDGDINDDETKLFDNPFNG